MGMADLSSVALLTLHPSNVSGRSYLRMKAKKFLTVSMLAVLMGLVGGCHEQSIDGYRGYGNSYGSYRDGFRDGRAYERRRDDWRDSRYRYDYSRDRW
jgi:hypothetical protein